MHLRPFLQLNHWVLSGKSELEQRISLNNFSVQWGVQFYGK